MSTPTIHFHDVGAGPAVLLLHGCPSTTTCFGSLVRTLSRSRRVLVPDLPGYGRSPAPTGRYDLEAVRSQIEDELRRRDVRDCSVVGYSAGAYRALTLALSTRIRVTSVVCIAGLAGYDEPVRAALRDLAASIRTGTNLRGGWLARMAGPRLADRDPGAASDILGWLDAAPPEVLGAELEAFAEAPDLRPRLHQVGVPVLARVGDLDVATPPSFSRDIARGVQRGVLEVVQGCAHALLHEDESETVASICRALAVG